MLPINTMEPWTQPTGFEPANHKGRWFSRPLHQPLCHGCIFWRHWRDLNPHAFPYKGNALTIRATVPFYSAWILLANNRIYLAGHFPSTSCPFFFVHWSQIFLLPHKKHFLFILVHLQGFAPWRRTWKAPRLLLTSQMLFWRWLRVLTPLLTSDSRICFL